MDKHLNEGHIIMAFPYQCYCNESAREVPAVFEYVTTCYLVFYMMAVQKNGEPCYGIKTEVATQ